LHQGDLLPLVMRGEDGAFETFAGGAERIRDREGSIGELGGGERKERIEGARLELCADGEALADEAPAVLASARSEYSGAVALDHEVHARMGYDLLDEGLAQIPPRNPIALDEERELLRRGMSREREVSLGGLRLQNAALAHRRGAHRVVFLQY